MSASLACFAGVLGEPDSSAAAPLQLQLDSAAACEMLLSNVLRILAAAVALRPLELPPAFPPAVLARVPALLLAGSTDVQGGAMALLAALLAAAPYPPVQPLVVLDSLRQALQQRAQQAADEAGGQPAEQGSQWWEQLVTLLQVLLDTAGAASSPGPVLSALASVALQALQAAGGVPGVQLQLCQLLRDVAGSQPGALEHHAPQLVQLLAGFAAGSNASVSEAACCEQLSHTLLLSLSQFSAAQVQEALAAAAAKTGASGGEVRPRQAGTCWLRIGQAASA